MNRPLNQTSNSKTMHDKNRDRDKTQGVSWIIIVQNLVRGDYFVA